MRERIKNIVIDEFSKLTGLIEADFQANFKRKVNNFLLSQMDERITASMVFVSSFESKVDLQLKLVLRELLALNLAMKMYQLL